VTLPVRSISADELLQISALLVQLLLQIDITSDSMLRPEISNNKRDAVRLGSLRTGKFVVEVLLEF
jgi:hypothetical protein